MKAIDIFPEIADDLKLLESELYKVLEVSPDDGLIHEASTHLLKAGGKRLRPALLLLAAKFNRYDLEQLMPLAVAVELVHMATLIHDDVVDQSVSRRGLATVNAKWDAKVSVLTGDYLFARAFALVAQWGDNEIVRIFSRVVYQMCMGEMRQVAQHFNPDLTEKDYLERIDRKTALFIAECCHVGAIASGADAAQRRALRSYGYGVGMGFQIVDDVLDITGSSLELGKPVASDLRAGILTLPVIHSLRHGPDRDRLRALVTGRSFYNGEVEEVAQIVAAGGSIDYSLRVAADYIDNAKRHLAEVPPVSVRDTLAEVADFIVARTY